MSTRKKHNGKGPYVPVEDCKEKHTRIENALFGPDGRGGMVADIADIKSKLGVLRTVAMPIILSVATAVITAWALGKI